MTRAEDFFYKCGKAETRTPWFPPDPEFLNSWRDEFFQSVDLTGYTLWLCGSVMEDWPTNDIDIIVTGEITNYQHLEDILFNAKQIGFKHRQLIDMAWNDYYKKFLIKGRCERRAICCEHFYEHDWCTLEECTARVEDVQTIVLGNEIIKNDEVITQRDPNAERLSESLWKINITSPSEKQIKRMYEGRVYKHGPQIITADLDFKDVVNWA